MSTQSCAKCGGEDKEAATMCSACGTPYPVPDPNDAPEIHKGQLIANRYVILDRIGQGGMGCIYKVQDNTLGEVVALKTLLPAYVQDKVVVERFFNEARIARNLSHPHIVRVHDIGTSDDIVYISMELLPGRTLRSMLDKMVEGRKIPLNAILRMFDALCAALEYAHSFTVHRDIKPENVMVLPDGTIKLMDFGISKLMSNPNMTSASMIMGTPHYMSPEQLKSSANVDGRADIYSVGVMLYESLTGAVPTGIGRRTAIQNALPPSLSPIVLKCCQHDPAQRYQKIGELRDALRAVREQLETGIKPGTPLSTPSPTSATPVIKAPSDTGRKITAIAGILALCVGASFAVSWANARRTAVLEEAVIIANTVPEKIIEATPARVVAGDTFTQMRQVLKRAEQKAVAAAQEDMPHILDLLDEANTMANSAKTMEDGWLALHRYLAIVHTPRGTEFIPGGEVQYTKYGRSITAVVPGFFIDQQEITAGQFRQFSNGNKWIIHPIAQEYPRDISMRMVGYYDAIAYLSSQPTPQQLPTEAQFAQAVYATKALLYTYDSTPPVESTDTESEESTEEETTAEESLPLSATWLPNFYEWTRMENEDRSPEELLGATASIMTAHTRGEDYVLGPISVMPYERYHQNVGFRGVVEMPSTLAEANAWLAQSQ